MRREHGAVKTSWLLAIMLSSMPLLVASGCSDASAETPVDGKSAEPKRIGQVERKTETTTRTRNAKKPEAERAEPQRKKTKLVEPDPLPKLEQKTVWLPAGERFPRLQIRGTLCDGALEGKCTGHTVSGDLCLIEMYKAGILHGKKTEFYPSGAKYSETLFVDGVQVGPHRTWFESGKLAGIITFRNGIPNGRQVTYFENGMPCVDGQNVDGQPEGVRRHYVPNGRQFGTTAWRNGREVDRMVSFEPTVAEFNAITRTSAVMDFTRIWSRHLAGK